MSTNTPGQQEEDMIHIYCSAENPQLCFKVSFPIFCLNVLKFSFSLADAFFELSLEVNTGNKSLSEI